MNKRINELAIQCGGIWRGGYVNVPNGDSVYTDKKFVDGSELNVTQFAELIVQECIHTVESHGGMGGAVAGDKIRKQFGVK